MGYCSNIRYFLQSVFTPTAYDAATLATSYLYQRRIAIANSIASDNAKIPITY